MTADRRDRRHGPVPLARAGRRPPGRPPRRPVLGRDRALRAADGPGPVRRRGPDLDRDQADQRAARCRRASSSRRSRRRWRRSCCARWRRTRRAASRAPRSSSPRSSARAARQPRPVVLDPTPGEPWVDGGAAAIALVDLGCWRCSRWPRSASAPTCCWPAEASRCRTSSAAGRRGGRSSSDAGLEVAFVDARCPTTCPRDEVDLAGPRGRRGGPRGHDRHGHGLRRPRARRRCPAVVGQSREDAQQALEDAGFKVKVEEAFSDDVPEGDVISPVARGRHSRRQGPHGHDHRLQGPERSRCPSRRAAARRGGGPARGRRAEGRRHRAGDQRAAGHRDAQDPAAGDQRRQGRDREAHRRQGAARGARRDRRRPTEDEATAALEQAGFKVQTTRPATGSRAGRHGGRPGPGRRATPRPPGATVTIFVGTLAEPSRRRPRRRPRPTPDAMRVAVLAGGRSSEHDVSLNSAAAVREGVAAAGHEVLAVTIERSGAWLHDGDDARAEPGGGLLGADAVFPVLHGPFGEDGTRPGAARAARRALRRRRRARLLAVHGQGRLQGGAGRRRGPAGRPTRASAAALAGGARRRARASWPCWAAGLRQARAPRLLGRDREGRRRPSSTARWTPPSRHDAS